MRSGWDGRGEKGTYDGAADGEAEVEGSVYVSGSETGCGGDDVREILQDGSERERK
jgi:hypothetical protein